ncbi:hypothetical protein J3R82DRAFT_9301 [Butyriboletus roseoflavus]|nr:hypothetical protein J3R82DRAFT_9301 [Butyriboletus roseoflavus]
MDAIKVSSRELPEPSGIPMPRGTVVPANAHNLKATPSSSSSPNVHGKRTAIFIQDDCLKHRFIRSRDTSGIFERPERLRAVQLGLAAAISRIEDAESAMSVSMPEPASVAQAGTDEGDLTAALARMAIAAPTAAPASSNSRSSPLRTASVTIRRTSTSISLLDQCRRQIRPRRHRPGRLPRKPHRMGTRQPSEHYEKRDGDS